MRSSTIAIFSCVALLGNAATASHGPWINGEPVYLPMNVFLFPSFEEDWGPWNRAGGAERVSDGSARSGEWCFHAPAQSTITCKAFLENDRRYELAAWVKGKGPLTASIRIALSTKHSLRGVLYLKESIEQAAQRMVAQSLVADLIEHLKIARVATWLRASVENQVTITQ